MLRCLITILFLSLAGVSCAQAVFKKDVDSLFASYNNAVDFIEGDCTGVEVVSSDFSVEQDGLRSFFLIRAKTKFMASGKVYAVRNARIVDSITLYVSYNIPMPHIRLNTKMGDGHYRWQGMKYIYCQSGFLLSKKNVYYDGDLNEDIKFNIVFFTVQFQRKGVTYYSEYYNNTNQFSQQLLDTFYSSYLGADEFYLLNITITDELGHIYTIPRWRLNF